MFASSILVAVSLIGAPPEQPAPLELVQTVSMEYVKGRIDGLAADPQAHFLYVAATEFGTLEVIDLQRVLSVRAIEGLNDARSVCVIGPDNQIFVTTGQSGACRMFDARLSFLGSLKQLDDAETIRLDPNKPRLYIGYGKGTIAVIGTEKSRRLGDMKLHGHPVSLQVETGGRRLFASVPSAGDIAVLDRYRGVELAQWPIDAAKENGALALDEANKRLFVACRKPSKIVVLDTDTGKATTSFDCCGDVGDVSYDAARGRLYVTGGKGCIDVFEQRDANHYAPIAKLTTVAGARTSLFISELSRLYVAVPGTKEKDAEIRVYQARP